MEYTHHPKRWFAGSIGFIAVIAMIAMSVGLGSATPSSSSATGAKNTVGHARPHATSPRKSASTPVLVTAFHQEFTNNTAGFCNDPSNPPCDGNGPAGDYGTIDRVSSGFSNGGFGNYAPSTPALHNNGAMAVVSGTGVVNQGHGCPSPGVEACTGPYSLFGTSPNQGDENVFPSNGFTVTSDVYLSPSTSTTTPVPSQVDVDISLNLSSTGEYGIDNVTTACFVPGGYAISFGNGSPGSCGVTPVVTADGWYRFVSVFSNVAGIAYLTSSVLSDPGFTQVATSGSQPVGGTPTLTSTYGGPGYFWLPTENISGLPLDNFALQLGQHPTGYTPTP
jgi:hypothetical protein